MKGLLIAIMAVFLLGITISNVYADSLGEKWSSIVSELSAAEKPENTQSAPSHLEAAKEIYINNFQAAALANDPADDSLITNTFSNSIELIKAGKIDQVKLNRQIIDKTIYKITYHQIENAIAENDPEKLQEWFTVMEKKFKFSEKDYATNNALKEISTSKTITSENGDIIKSDLLGIFKLKTFEEIEEAIQALTNDDNAGAQKFAYEGLYYYRTLHGDLERKLGSEKADELLHEMEEVIEVTTSGMSNPEMIVELKHILAEVELILAEYSGGDTSELGLVLTGIKDRLTLVDIEYADAVADGAIVDQKEYDETIVFLTKAIELYNENSDAISSLSESDSSSLISNLNEIQTIVASYGDHSKVKVLVDSGLENVSSLQSLSGGVVEKDALDYIDEIERLLNQAKSEYGSGNNQAAFNLVTEAYLDNYEFVEGPLGEVDRELMEKIEIDMREDLRNMIKTGAPVSEVDSQIDMILEDLTIARQVVPEFGTIAVMILAAAIVSIIAITARSKLNLLVKI